MSAQPPGPPPVAGLPPEALPARAEDLARRWAVALVVARPLAQLGGIPLEDIARDAPALCGRLLAALGSEAELERLAAGAADGRGGPGAAALGALAGVSEPAALALAVEALRHAAFELVLDEMPGAESASGRRVADVADRLAHVCAVALAAALDARAAAPATQDGSLHTPARAHETQARVAEWEAGEPLAHAPATAQQAPVAPQERGRAGTVAIVDELATARTSDAASASVLPPRELDAAEEARRPGREGAGEVAEIAIRDERGFGGEGPAAWIDTIGGQLRRYERERVPFAVMLVELLDLDRLAREQTPQELAALSARVEALAAGELGGPAARATLTVERPGRYWLVVADADRTAAQRLERRLAHAVSSRAAHRVVVGTAVCPEDGESEATLAAHADVGLYAARADARAAAVPPPGA